jgi:hypothetical protein
VAISFTPTRRRIGQAAVGLLLVGGVGACTLPGGGVVGGTVVFDASETDPTPAVAPTVDQTVTLTVTNPGVAPSALNASVGTGDGVAFTWTRKDCAGPLAAGDSCDIVVSIPTQDLPDGGDIDVQIGPAFGVWPDSLTIEVAATP